ncbi:T9SS type A sorting domain-containing protein [Formosa haliotis]|uniref:T9SS type A sorting domain-containing protein n=1 Tax=Formosa haliotis TaxID=1555194 RepID=UPI000824FB6E|nr:T9SS type A sorting domain-containing protein [Formosa haliotis]
MKYFFRLHSYVTNQHLLKKVLIAVFIFFNLNLFSQQLAFPSAQGFGKYAIGGRGGKVIKVTNLNDSGFGSLRAALESSGARTIVFEVGGIITLKQNIYIKSGNLTIAGQTAPGDGILIKGGMIQIEASDIVIRFLRFRPGAGAPDGIDALSLTAWSGKKVEKVIIDHCSISWGIDENFNMRGVNGGVIQSVTLQNSIISECGYGALGFSGTSDVTFYNNLFAHNGERNVRSNYPESGKFDFELINNLIYGFRYATVPSLGSKFTVINNIYKASNQVSISSGAIVEGTSAGQGNVSDTYAYIKGNIINSGLKEYNSALTPYIKGNYYKTSGINPSTATTLESKLLDNVGSSYPNRDEVDKRIVDQYKSGTGTLLKSGTFPNIKGGTPLKDTDNDGMPDSWEIEMGLDINDPTDRNIVNSDGYTNLEWYLNGINSDNSPQPSLEVNAGEDQTICEEESVILKATGASTYEWSTGEKTQSITVKPTKTTTYTVTGKDASGNTDTDEVKVTVNEIPTVSAGDDVTTCEDQAVELTATGSGTFKWSTGETSKTITVQPDKTTTYTVTASNGTCSSSDDVKVTVSPRQTVNAGSDKTIGLGESTTLSVTGTGSIKWSTGETTREITVSPTRTTNYTVTVTQNGCESQDQVRVIVQAISIEADAGDDQTICEGETVTLTANGGSSYTWSTGETSKSITVSPKSTTTYSVEVKEGSATATAEVTVNVNALPTANAGANQTIEQGESVTLSATGGSRYKWNTGATTQNITVSPNTTTTYTVEVFNANDCSDTDQVRVTVNATKLEADAGDDQTICEGETVTLTASGGSSFIWNTGETSKSITVSPKSTTTYSVEVKEGSATATAEVTVNVNALPTANAGANQTIEQGESVTLSATGGSRYKWNTGATTQNITVSPNTTTTYTVEVFNANDCSDTDQVRVTVNATKLEADAGDDQTICEGETVTLTASGGSSFIWNTGETSKSITVSPKSTTTYSVEVKEGSATATAEVTVNVNALPTANAGANQTIEQGESVTLSATGGSRYKWNTGATTQNITVSPNTTTTYTVEVFNANDCSDTDQVRVTVNATKLEADAGDDQTICEGETVTLTASGGSSFIWNTGETSKSITVSPKSTTTYSVEVKEGSATATAEVTVNVNALPTANAGANQTIEQGESVTLSATGGSRYKWNTGATTQNITVSPNTTTTYTVEVFNENDCSDTDQVRVIVQAISIEADAGDDQTICEGETVTLTASGGSSFIWNTGETSKSITVSPKSTTTYSVEVKEGSATATAEVTVNVNALPTANAGANQTIEQGESVTLSATGGSRYKWNTGATTQNITVSPNTTTTYTVEVFNENDCSDTDQVRVIVQAISIEADAGDDQTICEGETVTLTASGGSSFIWNTGETSKSITVSPKSTTTYSVEVKEGSVTATAEVTINVNALPTANAGANQTIEQGESVTLSATGGSRYKWNTGATTQNITVSPNTTTTYTVEVFNANDCSDTDQVRVTVNATKLEADAGDDQTICEGETVTLTASGGSAYIWNTGETSKSITVSPKSTTTYSVEVKEGSATATAEVTVNVNALPTANAGANQTIEQGESVTLSATGGSRYKWNTGATTQNITVSPNTTTTYTVEVFNANDCSDTDQVRVTVNATKLEADAGDDQTICEGETVTLTASGGSSFIWNTGETSKSITVSPKSTTTYSVEVKEGSATATAEVTINVNALPTANAGANQTIEQGESVTLSATGGSRYKWNTGATTQNITVSPNTTTTYTVEVFNANDCSDTDQVRVTVNATKLEADAGDDQTICEGETVTLTASGGSSFIWNTGETSKSITVSPKSTTTYSVEVKEGSATATAEVTVNVNALPTANAGANQTIEQGESVTLSATGGSRYKWNTGATTQNITVSPNTTTTYTVEVFNANDCSDTDQVRVTVNATKLEADAGDDQTICEGETVTLTASGGSSFIWNTGETSKSITVSPKSTTTYSVEVANATSRATAEVTVNVYAMPIADAGSDQTILEGESVILTASGGASYLWNTGQTTQSIEVSPSQTTLFSVEVSNEGGCASSDDVVVTVESLKDEGESLIPEKLDFEFSVYPNPTSDILNIKIAGLEHSSPVQIYDMSGKVLYNEVIESDGSLMKKTIDLSSYPKGFYMLTLYRYGRPISKKIVLK